MTKNYQSCRKIYQSCQKIKLKWKSCYADGTKKQAIPVSDTAKRGKENPLKETAETIQEGKYEEA
ncbi:hypothetical protein BRYFOR_09534 [Marvinbryantia formatexigens DSM 14469]|uniref:Uncharacterized protein n=1 Tax=Marvinbryantia formatexigens DSM 14469 TaxID=478749 RepID=C6LLI7_9FIRM|nr:hypothetical protein [Marvinbryantia formatexigens]EET58526.1 hypothetical protein BRYFOR_09534 [Marvinbryantia formatexigens DSM 14469]